jgi:serine/threonine protein phosphatase 1
MNTERYYCLPDIHGCSDMLSNALNHIYENNPDGCKIIFLGDYIDRGPDNLGVLRTVMNPPKAFEFICLMGNHEEMFVRDWYVRNWFYDYAAAVDIAGLKNVNRQLDYAELHDAIDPEIIRWMENLKIFHFEDKNVFAHAFYDDTLPPSKQYTKVCLWDRMSDHEKYWNDNQGFYLTHGHTPRKHGPVKATNRVNLDAGAAYYGRYVIGEYHKNIQGPVAFHEFFGEAPYK